MNLPLSGAPQPRHFVFSQFRCHGCVRSSQITQIKVGRNFCTPKLARKKFGHPFFGPKSAHFVVKAAFAAAKLVG